jgi:hypothetical protein
MSRESFPQQNSTEEFPPAEATPENPESVAASPENKEFGWNDIIVAEEDQEAVEKVAEGLGFSCKSKELSARQFTEPAHTSWLAGEVLLSIVNSRDNRPVDRQTLKTILAMCKENPKGPIPVRVARLAPGEHLG